MQGLEVEVQGWEIAVQGREINTFSIFDFCTSNILKILDVQKSKIEKVSTFCSHHLVFVILSFFPSFPSFLLFIYLFFFSFIYLFQ